MQFSLELLMSQLLLDVSWSHSRPRLDGAACLGCSLTRLAVGAGSWPGAQLGQMIRAPPQAFSVGQSLGPQASFMVSGTPRVSAPGGPGRSCVAFYAWPQKLYSTFSLVVKYVSRLKERR